jgi:hypothetical protein
MRYVTRQREGVFSAVAPGIKAMAWPKFVKEAIAG